MEAGFRQWLSESEENRIEFEGLTDIWTAVGAAPATGAPRLERWEHSAESREIQELLTERSEMSSRANRASPERRKTRLGLALAASILPVLFVAWWLLKDPATPIYVTDVGEGRMVQLSDKSRIWMNSDTRLRVAFDSQQRRVELIRGEAFFEVARNVSRPFVVAVGEHAVTAVGTAFVVRYEESRTAVTLVEGKVAISSSSPTPGEVSPAILTAGQRLTLPPAGVPKIDEPAIESVLAWRHGEVVLNDTPLREAVSEMNRYDKTTIVVEGSAIETLNISGLFHTGDNEGFARSVAKMYHLDLQEHDGRIYLNSR
jgi:transmembrane sensor